MASVQVDDVTRDGQSQPRAFRGAADPVELVENPLHVLSGNTRPVVTHRHGHGRGLFGHPHRNGAPRRRVLDRVAHEVHQHLPDQVGVDIHLGQIPGRLNGHFLPLFLDPRPQRAQGLPHQRFQIQQLQIQELGSEFQAAEIKDAVDHAQKAVGLLLDDPQEFRGFGKMLVGDPAEQHIRVGGDGGKRRPEFMARHGHETALQLVDAPQDMGFSGHLAQPGAQRGRLGPDHEQRLHDRGHPVQLEGTFLISLPSSIRFQHDEQPQQGGAAQGDPVGPPGMIDLEHGFRARRDAAAEGSAAAGGQMAVFSVAGQHFPALFFPGAGNPNPAYLRVAGPHQGAVSAVPIPAAFGKSIRLGVHQNRHSGHLGQAHKARNHSLHQVRKRRQAVQVSATVQRYGQGIPATLLRLDDHAMARHGDLSSRNPSMPMPRKR